MKIKYENIPIIMYSICIFIYAIMQSKIPNISDGIMIGCKMCMLALIAICLVFEIKQKLEFDIKNILKVFIIVGLMVWNFIARQNDSELVFIIVFMILCRKCLPNKLLYSYSMGVFSAIIIVLIFSEFNIISNDLDANGRYDLGYIYATFGPNLYLSACLAYIGSKKDKVNVFTIIVLLIGNFYFYEKTKTIAVFVLIIMAVILHIIIMYFNGWKLIKNKKIFDKVIIYSPLFFAIITVIIQLYYNKSGYRNIIWIKIDEALSYRLTLGKIALKKYSISLFGQAVKWKGENAKNYFYIDSSYLNILLTYGIVTLSGIVLIFKRILKFLLDRKFLNLIIVVLIFLIHSITDPQLLTFRYDPFILIYVYALLEKNKERKELKNEQV